MFKKTRLIEPEVTFDGRYICKADNRIFNTKKDYERHCTDAHLTQASRAW